MKVLIPLLALFALLTSSFRASAPASYLPMNLSEMVMASELTVHGTIIKVKKKTFVLKVETVFKGELKPGDKAEGKKEKRVEVERFQNWVCASRWTEYKVGQEVVLFLTSYRAKHAPLRILSGGGEGEMPAFLPIGQKDDKKWLALRGRGMAEIGVKKPWVAYGSEGECNAAPLKATLEDLEEFHTCFKTGVKPGKGTWHTLGFEATKLQSEERVQKLARRSELAKYLVNQARAAASSESKK